MNKVGYSYTMEYYSAMKRNGVPIYPTTWLNLKTSRLTEKKNTVTKGHVLCDSTHMKCPELRNPEKQKTVIARGWAGHREVISDW